MQLNIDLISLTEERRDAIIKFLNDYPFQTVKLKEPQIDTTASDDVDNNEKLNPDEVFGIEEDVVPPPPPIRKAKRKETIGVPPPPPPPPVPTTDVIAPPPPFNQREAEAKAIALVGRCSQAIETKLITIDEANGCCLPYGIVAFPFIMHQLEHVVNVAKDIDALIASRKK